MKKLLSLLLTLLLLLSSLPSFAAAEPVEVGFEQPDKTLKPGDAFELKFTVKNTSDVALHDITSLIQLPSGGNFYLDPNFKEMKVQQPPAVSTPSEAPIFIMVPRDRYTYSLNPKETLTLSFKLKVATNPNGSNDVGLRTVYAPKVQDGVCPITTKFDITKTVSLAVDTSQTPPNGGGPGPSDDFDFGGDFFGGGGGGFVDLSGGGVASGGETQKNKPKLIITEYSFEPKMPKAGEEFTMTLTFLNTNSEKSCRNIKIFLTTDATVEAPPTQGATPSGGGGGGGVFSPVGSSNTFYIGYIGPQETVKKTIKFFVVPTAVSKSYTMTANFEYEDYEGKELTATELIGIPVVQSAKIQMDDPTISAMGPGMPLNLDVRFYNTGRDNLTNFMVSVDGEGFTPDQQRYFVGNFATGSSDSFNTNLMVQQPGEVTGKVVITYEDSTGTSHTVEKEFKDYYEEMPPFDPEQQMPFDPMGEQKPFYTKPIFIGGTLAVLAALAYFIFRRRRNKKKAEDLFIHEDL